MSPPKTEQRASAAPEAKMHDDAAGEDTETLQPKPEEAAEEGTESSQPKPEDVADNGTESPEPKPEDADEEGTESPEPKPEDADEEDTESPEPKPEDADEEDTETPPPKQEEADEEGTESPEPKPEDSADEVTESPPSNSEEATEEGTQSPRPKSEEADEHGTESPPSNSEEATEEGTESPRPKSEEADEHGTESPQPKPEDAAMDAIETPQAGTETPQLEPEDAAAATTETPPPEPDKHDPSPSPSPPPSPPPRAARAPTKRRSASAGPAPPPDRPPKRRRVAPVLNHAPTQRLQVAVFGTGENGELGLGQAAQTVVTRPRRNDLLGAADVGVVQLAVGAVHCAALTHDGRVLTWGVNDARALGRDTAWQPSPSAGPVSSGLNPYECTPIEVRAIADLGLTVTQVAVTDNATFVLTAEGLVYGWGCFYGDDGAFGFLKEKIEGVAKPTPAQLFQETPVQIAGLRRIKELAAGVNHVLALDHDGVVYAWGSGHQAELGRRLIFRHQAQSLVPRAVCLPRRAIVAIFAGFNHSFALDRHGRVWTWGLNNFGQTGVPLDDDALHIGVPVLVDGLRDYAVARIAGGFHHSIACLEDGRVLAWGRCDDGQLGFDVSELPQGHVMLDVRDRPRILTVPTVIPDLEATYVAAGIDNCLAINTQGKVLSWGFSENYRTGLNTEETVHRPQQLGAYAIWDCKFTSVGCGSQFSVIAGPPPAVPPRRPPPWASEGYHAWCI